MISAGMLIPHLKEHADDGHHRQPGIGQLRRQLFGLLSWVAGRQDLEAEVARCGWRAGRLVLGNLAEGHVREDLSPSCGRNFGDRCEAVGHVVVVVGTVRPVLATRRAPVKRDEIHPQPHKRKNQSGGTIGKKEGAQGQRAKGKDGKGEREREREKERERERALTVARGRIRHVGSSKFAD